MATTVRTIRRLEARDVVFAYEQGADVLKGVGATVESGVVSGMVGPNGSGKSTLLRLLCGLLEPQQGAVELDGRPLRSMAARARARVVAFLPQGVDPAFSLTVAEAVSLGRYPRLGPLAGLGAEDIEVVERCLRDTETEDLRSREFLTLSGGERQRVLLATILAQEPDLLLLDEPTSALDIHHQVEVMALLRRLAETGYGVGVVTHDLNLAARFCDAVLLLSQDHAVLAQGAPEEVLTEPLLSEAYGWPIRVTRHPTMGAPLVSAEVPRTEDAAR